MSDIAIRVDKLSKLYRIGAAQAQHDTLRDAVTGIFRRRPSPLAHRPSDTDLWALKDVSFEVKQGEVVGIIGRNGAGKSTLLKILSRITEPTSGRVTLHGRVASLLEVGTGFHPELTGRENVYLNGAILGMKRREIDRKFDQIVAFAEIERFLDTPVKRYSSGMYVRLAFAVAAHLDPEILLVDEVLAVGDVAFQRKCLGKMGDVARNGRTVLFVSHNLAAISDLCDTSILLSGGQVDKIGPSTVLVDAYIRNKVNAGRFDVNCDLGAMSAYTSCKISFVETRNSSGMVTSNFSYGEDVVVRVGIVGGRGKEIILGVGIRDSGAHQVLHFNNRDDGASLTIVHPISSVEMCFKNTLNTGGYYITVWIGNSLLATEDYLQDCLHLSVDNSTSGIFLAKGMIIQHATWAVADRIPNLEYGHATD